MRSTTPRIAPRILNLPGLAVTLLLATGGQAQWENILPGGSVYSVVVTDEHLFVGEHGGTIQRSDDQGANWTVTNTGITDVSNWWLDEIEGVLFCGTQFGSTFRSIDNGDSWTNVGMNAIRGFAMHHDTLYACAWYTAHVSISTDLGATWTPLGFADGNGGLWPMLSHNGYLYLGAQNGGVSRRQYSTGPWEQVNTGLTTNTVYAFCTLGDTLFCGGAQGVFYSVDGATWAHASDDITAIVYALDQVDGQLYAGLATGGVWHSADGGATWTAMNDGIPNMQVARLTHDDDYLYAGTLGGGLCRYDFTPSGSGLVETSNARLSIHPVPATDRVTVEGFGAAGPTSVWAVDLTGRRVALPTHRAGDRLIADVSSLHAGEYLLRVIAEGTTYAGRFVVE